uniref:HMG box domain-containing protein n=1 Tax=Peronospora matthiolae TaxID=2874970 RepID=A0AAV1VER1_9STRA
MARVKKPQSSYLHFCHEKRKQVMDEHPGARIGDIQKVISVQWQALTSEEKEVFVQMAVNDKARYQRELQDKAEVQEEPSEEAKDVLQSRCACVYPLARVRKIVQSDPDMGKVSKDALVAIAKAAELFAQFLGTKSYEQALYRNKRQIKASDVTRTIQTTASLDWLRPDFPDVKLVHADGSGGSKRMRTDQEKSEKALPDTASFFEPRTAGATGGAAPPE